MTLLRLLSVAFILALAFPTAAPLIPTHAAVGADATCGAPAAEPGAATPESDADLASRLDALVADEVADARFAGSVLVARGDAVLLAKGYGLADRSRGVPNTPRTTYRIGSLTKQFTALAVMQLQEAGRLAVDDPITAHLPDYPTPAKDGVPITLHHLLSHTSGVPDLFRFASPMDQAAWPATPQDLAYGIARDHGLDFVPGTAWAYSNTGYLLLGLVVERAAGQPYAAYLRDHIFAPLGMRASGFEAAGDARPCPAAGYLPGFGDVDVSALTRLDIAFAAGGMHSTVEDLYRWDRALSAERLASEASLQRLFGPVAEGYGYGWDSGEVAGRRTVEHNGEIDGFASSILRVVDDGVLVVVLANRQDANLGAIAERLAEAALVV